MAEPEANIGHGLEERSSKSGASFGHSVGHSIVPGSFAGTPSQRGYADLCRLARFGANLADAHSCFIFFHASVIASLDPSLIGPEGVPDTMVLAGFHSLCPEVIPHSQVSRGNGLVGWVAKHARSIHVSPFELDSRTLGIYSSDQQLKSFIGIPIRLDDTYGMLASSGAEQEHLTGVLACDSKKSFAFSKLQGKLLEDLAREVSSTVGLLVEQQGRAHPDVAWHSFLRRASELSRSVGIQSLEVTRIVPTNFHALERSSGTSAALTAVEQVYRIVQQILPPHFPCVRLANGDIVIALDNMMISFYESRIRAVSAHHLSRAGSASVEALQFEFVKAGGRDKRRKTATVEELVQLTSTEPAELRNSLASGLGAQGGVMGLGSQGAMSHDAKGPSSSSVLRLDKEVGYGYRRA